MKEVTKTAGNVAAHAIWSVSEGEILIPLVGILSNDNKTNITRMIMGSAQAVAAGNAELENLDSSTKGGVFVKDVMVELETGRTDALAVDVRFSDDKSKLIGFLIPYRNAKHQDGFAVHRLKITKFEGFNRDELDELSQSFMEGLESHEEGGKIWLEQYVDQAGSSTTYYEENTSFNEEEFTTLIRSPLVIFIMVAAADGKVDKNELSEFLKVLSNSEMLENELFSRIVTNIIDRIPSMIQEILKSQFNMREELLKVKEILEAKLSESEANEYKLTLFKLAKAIAESSGGFFGFGSKISKEEKVALAAIVLTLGIKVA